MSDDLNSPWGWFWLIAYQLRDQLSALWPSLSPLLPWIVGSTVLGIVFRLLGFRTVQEEEERKKKEQPQPPMIHYHYWGGPPDGGNSPDPGGQSHLQHGTPPPTPTDQTDAMTLARPVSTVSRSTALSAQDSRPAQQPSQGRNAPLQTSAPASQSDSGSALEDDRIFRSPGAKQQNFALMNTNETHYPDPVRLPVHWDNDPDRGQR
jgi:hypothetical protein